MIANIGMQDVTPTDVQGGGKAVVMVIYEFHYYYVCTKTFWTWWPGGHDYFSTITTPAIYANICINAQYTMDGIQQDMRLYIRIQSEQETSSN